MDWIAASRGVVRIPDGVPFEQAAFLEPVNTVLKGVKMLNLAADDTVLVIGQGPIGLMHAALARRTGARVLTSDLYPERHAIAAKFGLHEPDSCRHGERSRAGLCRDRRPRRGCRHSGRRRQRADQDRHGRGASRRQGDALCPDPVRRGHLRSRRRSAWTKRPCSAPTRLRSAIQDEVTELVFGGYRNGFDLTQLISHRFPLEEAVEAIEVASNPQADSMKIMIEPVPGAGAEWGGERWQAR